MVRADRRSWLPAVVWSLAALVSVSVAVWVALQPDRLVDLHQVHRWLIYVQGHAGDPYAYFNRELDYPPVALLLLAPLGWIPEASLGPWFLPISVAITALAGWVFVHAVAERLYTRITLPQHIALVGIILSGGAVRGAIWLGQTMALSVLLGTLALLWSRRHPFAAALALALCAFKPHLGFGFGLAILFIDGLDVVVVAVAIFISLSLLVSAMINQSILAIVSNYVSNLMTIYGGPDGMRGLLSLSWVFDDVFGSYAVSTVLYLLIAVGSLVLIGAAAKRANDAAGRTQAVAAALLWPLLFMPSQLYNGVLTAPAVWLLMWPEGRLIKRESARLAIVSAVVTFSVFDVPRVARLVSDTFDDSYWLYKGSYYLSPLRIALLFGFILYVAFHRSHTPTKESGA